MIDWHRGGWTGSVNKIARRDVRQQLYENEAARRSRYGFFHRVIRRFFSVSKFGRFIGLYLILDAVAVVTEASFAKFAPSWALTWVSATGSTDLNELLLSLSSYLITAQVGVLGVITLALALVTIIAQQESSSTDIKIYYHESLAFEVVASCIALLTVLCAQLVWPAQVLILWSNLSVDTLFFRYCLFGVHIFWLLLNLGGLAHFISTTFSFVQQSHRELMRERYTANVLQPQEMYQRIRQRLYTAAAEDLLRVQNNSPTRPSVAFGFDFGDPYTVEMKSNFQRAVELRDVRMIWVKWVLNRWAIRCLSPDKENQPELDSSMEQGPLIWFELHLDNPIKGEVSWCKSRDGVSLTRFERLLLRRAFCFRRTKSDA